MIAQGHAAPPDGASTDTWSALVVGVRGVLYGFPQEGPAILLPWLQRYRRPSPLPAVPAWVAGLVSVRGTAQVVVDLGLFLGQQPFTPTPVARLVFVESGEHQVGFAVDAEVGVRNLSSNGPLTTGEVIAGEALLRNQPIKILNGDVLMTRLVEAMKKHKGGMGYGDGRE